MHRGHIKLHRKMLEWEWYSDANTLRLFLHLLLKANYKDGNYRGILIPRGSVVTGRKELSSQLQLSEQQIRTSMKKLKSTNEITSKITNKFSVVTINNYNEYQDSNQQDNQQVTSKQPANNRQVTTSKESNAVKKKEKKKKNTNVFKKPNVNEINEYMNEVANTKGYIVDLVEEPEKFFDFYEGKGWRVGSAPMKDWKAAIRNWLRNNYSVGGKFTKSKSIDSSMQDNLDFLNSLDTKEREVFA